MEPPASTSSSRRGRLRVYTQLPPRSLARAARMRRNWARSSMPTAILTRCSGTSGTPPGFAGGREGDQLRPLLDRLADGEADPLDDAVGRRRDRVLHLHRLDDEQRLAAPHLG